MKGEKLIKGNHVPVRTCLVCRGKKPKRELIRLALVPDGKCIVPDVRQRMKGRGGYACRECLPKLRFNKRIQRAFHSEANGVEIEMRPYV